MDGVQFFYIIEYRGGKVLQQWRGLDGNWNLQVTFAYLSTDEFLVFYSLEHFLKRPLTRSSPIQSTRRVENEGRAFSILYPLLNFRDQNNTFWPIFGIGPSVGGRCAETWQFFEILKEIVQKG